MIFLKVYWDSSKATSVLIYIVHEISSEILWPLIEEEIERFSVTDTSYASLENDFFKDSVEQLKFTDWLQLLIARATRINMSMFYKTTILDMKYYYHAAY